ncbi:MAG: hypothetical protein K5768_07795 [Firmicutes bacterium]|nr:hypothetical protein [Bacillota bacterium]
MKKIKKLISLVCALCITSTYAFIPSFGTNAVMAAAADVSQYLNVEKSASGASAISWSADTVTDNGDSSFTVTGTMNSSDGWNAHRTEIGFDSTMGSGVAQTIGHASWIINNPNKLRIDLAYRNGSNRYELAAWDMGVGATSDTNTGTIKDKVQTDFDATLDMTSYQGDFFINLETTEYRLYFNNVLFSEGSIGTTQFKNLFFNVRPPVGNFTYSISDVTREIYNSGATMNDVVAYTFKQRSANNYYWSVSGIGDIDGTDGKRIVGIIDWVNNGTPSYDGSNVIVNTSASADSGIAYRLRRLKSNGTYKTKGCLPQDAENDNIIHQSLYITPNLTNGNYAAIGFSGNNKPLPNKYKFGADNGFVSGRPYHFDILVNNKDKEFWILVDGEKRANGSIGDSYLSSIYYTIGTGGSDTLSLSNIVTKSYDYTVSMDSLLATLVNSSNYNWAFDGVDRYSTSIASGYSAPNGYASISGTNSGGYTISASNDSARFGYRLGNGDKIALPRDESQTNIIHQHLTFTPNFASGHTETIGVRGNNGYHDLFDISAANGFTSGTPYDMHIIINNQNFTYMFIVDGTIKMTGSIAKARNPLWEISYKIDSSGDSMILKNITTKYYKNTITMYALSGQYAQSNEAFMDYLFETDSNGYLAAEIDEAPCYNESKWQVNTSKRFYSGTKALSPKAKNDSGMDLDPNWTLNLSFTANKSGTNTYYLWVRHTASVINEDGRNFYIAIDKEGTTSDPVLKNYTAEATAPRWMLLGSITLPYDEVGYVKIRERQSNHVAWDKYVITTNSSYIPTDSAFGIAPPSSSRAKNMGTLSGGKLVFEAENAGYGSPFEPLGMIDTTYGNRSTYSGSAALKVASGSSASVPAKWDDSTGSIDAGDIEFNFTPDSTGSVYLWARYFASSTNKKFAVSVTSNDYATVVMNEADTKAWQKIATIDNVVAGVPVNIRIANVAGGYVLDKFAISSSIFDTPEGANPTWNTTSTTLSGGSPTITTATLPSHPRLYFTAGEIDEIEEASHSSENYYMYDLNENTYISKGLRSEFTGEVPASPGYQNYKPVAVARIEALAYDYAINGNAASGEKAASSLINYITTVSYTGLSTEDFNRKAGYDLFSLSKAYDWCYDCLTPAQRTAFINAGIKIASQLETGWPPSANSPMTGYASEGSFQSYLLAFAIAVADERPDIYNYVMGKIETEYVPAMIKLYGGSPMQGSRYGTFRGQHAFSAALMLKTIGYNNNDLYNALGNTMMHYIYARRPDGLMFIDGDDTNNGKTPYSYYSVGHMKNTLLHAIKLFGNDYGVASNSYFKDAAKWACYGNRQFSSFDGTFGEENYVTPSTFLILNGSTTLGNEANYSLPLSNFFDGAVTSMIARTGWTQFTTSNLNNLDGNDNTAVAYMKVGQYNAGNHQHLDAGNFQLYYKGILANDPCYYDNYTSDYMNGYAKRSVAHNVVLIKDGIANDIGGLSFADGGQTAVPDATTSAAKTASWEAHAISGDDVNRPDFTYMKANLTKSYRSATSYKRSFIFMNMDDENEPATLIVYDRIGTSSAKPTAWLLHGLKSPTINGKRAVFTTDTGGQMTNDTLLPTSVSINSYADGYVDSSHAYPSGYTAQEGKVNESEGYRIEVASNSATTTYFLNVVQAGDTGTTAANPALIESTNFYGVRLKDRVVLFNKDAEWFGGTKDQEYLFNFSSNDGYVYKFAIADAHTGSYEIYYSTNGSSYSLLAYAKTTDDSSHLLTFSGKAGYYKVVRKSNTVGGDTTSYATKDELKQLSPSVKIRQSGSNYIISASAKTYKTYAKADNTEYANKIVLAAYDSTGKVLGLRVVDFTTISKEADYVDIATLTSAPSGQITVKSMIFDGLGTIEPLTKNGRLDFLN